jgi:hypothetical protein
MNLLPTVHVGFAQVTFREFGVLGGRAVDISRALVAYVMTTVSHNGQLESKLMWDLKKV